MTKQIKAIVQNSEGEVLQALDVVQGSGDKGQVVRLPAVRGARYKLEDPSAGNTGPDSVRTKRIGKNLNVMLEGSTEPDLVLVNYYDSDIAVDGAGSLFGQAEDGNLYEYIPEDPTAANLPVALADGGMPVSQVLGGSAVSSSFQLAALPLLAVGGGALGGGGLLAAAAGVLGAAALATSGTAVAASGLALQPDMLDASDTGSSKTDNITSVTKPSFKVGVVPAGSTAQLWVDGQVVPTTATVDAAGNTVLTPVNALTEGKHALAFNYKNAAGTESANSPSLDITLDTSAPTAPATPTAAEASNGTINASKAADGIVVGVPVAGTGAAAGDMVTVALNGTPTTYVLKLADITAGVANVTVTKAALDAAGQGAISVTTFITDMAGNKGATSAPLALTVDSIAPTAPGVAVTPENSAGGINATEAADGSLVSVSIAATGAVEGDVLTITVDGVTTPRTLTAADIASGVVRMTVPKNVLDAAGQGSATVTSTLTDAAGNVSGVSPIATINLDTVGPTAPAAPMVPEAADGKITAAEAADGTVVEVSLAGTGAVVNDKVTVTIDGTSTPYTLLAADITAGKASVPIPKSVLDAAGQGTAAVTATITDVAGNVSPSSPATTIALTTADLPTPATPVATDDVGQTKGPLASGDVTDDTMPTLSGTATAGNTVQVLDNNVVIGTVTVPSGGAWTFTPTTPLSVGAHALSVMALDANGNKSAASAPLAITVNTTMPAVTMKVSDNEGSIKGDLAPNAFSDDTTPTFSGTATPGATVTLKDGSVTLGTVIAEATTGNWSFTPATAQTQGAHTYTANVSIAGNTATATQTITLDATAPNAPSTAPVVAENNNGGINAAEAADGTVIEVSLTDTGAVANDKVTVTVDGVATTYVLQPADIAAGKASVNIPKSVLDAAGEGTAIVTATLTDAAGNTSPVSAPTTITMATVVPATPLAPVANDDAGQTTGPIAANGVTDDNTPTLSGTGTAGNTVQVLDNGMPIGNATVGADGKWTFTPSTPLAEGAHAITSIVSDAFGNKSAASPALNLTVNSTPAMVTILKVTDNVGTVTSDVANNGSTDDAMPTLVGTASPNAVVTLKEGSTTLGTATADATGHWSFTPTTAQTEGAHTYTASVSVAGNTTSASFVVSVDTSSPAAPVVAVASDDEGSKKGPLVAGESTDDRTPTLSGTGTPGDTVKVYDGSTPIGSVKVKPDGTWTFTPTTPLAEGGHALSTTVTDPAGNESAKSPALNVVVDTVAPAAASAPVVAEAAGALNAAEIADGVVVEVSLAGTGAVAGDQVTVDVDGAPTSYTLKPADIVAGKASVTIPKAVFDAAGEGTAIVTATLTDAAGNTSPVSAPTVINIDTQGGGFNADVTFSGLTIDVANLPSGDSKDTGASNSDFVTSDHTLTIQGSVANFSNVGASSGDKVWVQIVSANGAVVSEGAASLNLSNTFTFSSQAVPLSDGCYTLKTAVVDASGNVVKAGDSQALVIDSVGNFNYANTLVDTNTGASIGGLSIQNSALGSNDTGTSSTDFITSDSTLVIEGTLTGFVATGGGAGDKVRVQIVAADGTTVVAQQDVTPDANNHFVFDNRAQALNDGKFTLKTSIVDSAGNLVKVGPTQTLVIDSNGGGFDPASNPGNTPGIDPNAGSSVVFSGLKINDTGASNTDFITAEHGILISGKVDNFTGANGGAGDRVWVQVLAADGVTVVAQTYVLPNVFDGTYTFDNRGQSLADGVYSIKTSVVDAAGNMVKPGDNQRLVIDTNKDGTAAGSNPANGTGLDTNTQVNFSAFSMVDASKGSADTGSSNTDFVTNDATLVFQGTAAGFQSTGASMGDRVRVQVVAADSVTVVAEQYVVPAGNGNFVFDNTANTLGDGKYTLKIAVVDAAGNIVKAGTDQALVIDTSATINPANGTASDTNTAATFQNLSLHDTANGSADDGASSTDFITTDSTLKIMGKVNGFTATGATAGDQVLVQVVNSSGSVVAQQFVTPDASGNYVLDNRAQALPEGSYTLKTSVVDAAGNTVKMGDSQPLVISGSAASSVFITGITSDNGASSTDFITNDNTLSISGNVTGFVSGSGNQVHVKVMAANGITLVAEQFVTPTASGAWTFDNRANALQDGSYSIKADLVNAAHTPLGVSTSQALVIDTAVLPDPALSFSNLTIHVPTSGSQDTGVNTDFITHDTTLVITGKVNNFTAAHVTADDRVLVQIVGSADAVVAATYVKPAADGTFTFDNTAQSLSDGNYTIKTSVVSKSGNLIKLGDSQPLTIDSVLPREVLSFQILDDQGLVTGEIFNTTPVSGTDDTQPEVKGTVAADVVKVNIYDGTSLIASVTPVAGAWSYTPASGLTPGVHTISASTVDAANNESAKSAAVSFNVVGSTPSAPAITGLADNVGDILGAIGQLPSGTNSVTDDTKPTLNGTGTFGTTVRVYDGAVLLGSTEVKADGSWSFEPANALTEGQHSITAQTVDAIGQVSPATGAYVFKVDTTAPATVAAPTATDDVGQTLGQIADGSVTDDATPTFSGTGTSGDTVQVMDNGVLLQSVSVADNGTWTYTPTTPLSNGVHAITTTATDPAGNKSAASGALNFTVNTAAVAVSISKVTDNVGSVLTDVTNGGVTDDTTPTLVGTATPGAVVTVKEGNTTLGTATADATTGSWSFTPATAQTQGAHTYTASVTVAGNTTTASYGVTIDTTAPSVPNLPAIADDVGSKQGPLTSGAASDDTTPTLSGAGTFGDTIKVYDGNVKVGEVLVKADGTWNITLTPLSEATHALSVTATDAAGNESGKSSAFTLTVDTTAPAAPSAAPASYVDDQGTVQSTTSSAATTDDTQPGINIGSVPAGTTPKLYVDGVLTDAAFANGVLTPVNPLSAGAHGITYKLEDAAGNLSDASPAINITVDTTAPQAPNSAPASYVDDVGTVQSTTSTAATTDDTKLGINIGAVPAGTTPKLYVDGVLTDAAFANGVLTPVNALTEGAHAITYKLADAAGNESAASPAISITVDTTAPQAPISPPFFYVDDVGTIQSPTSTAATTDDTKPGIIIGFTPAGIAAKLYVDGVLTDAINVNGVFTPVNALSEGAHAITYKLVDAAGNESAASPAINITVKTISPVMNATGPASYVDDVGVVQVPTSTAATTDDTQPGINIGTVPAGITPKLYVDGVLTDASFVNGVLTPTNALSEGAHAITYKLADAAGNESTASPALNVTVDTTAPVAVLPTDNPLSPPAGKVSLVLDAVTADNMINATEALATIGVTGKVYGEFTVGDLVTLTVNAKTFTGSVTASGVFNIQVPGSDLVADSNHAVDATFVARDAAGNAGSVSASQAYSVGTAPVAVADVANATEASGVNNAIAASNPSANVLSNDTDADVGDTKVVQDIKFGAGSVSAVTAAGTTVVGAYGSLLIKADGSYTYAVDNANATVEALNTTSTPLTETFTYTVKDSFGLTSSTTLTVSVKGANDAAVITGDTGAPILETDAVQTVSGDLTATDVDSASTFVVQTATAGVYGSFSVDASGGWRYSMFAAQNQLQPGQVVTDSFVVTTADGSTQTVAIDITGTNDAPVPKVSAVDSSVMAPVTTPSVSVVDNSETNIENNGIVTFSLEFSEPVDADTFTASDILVTNGTLVSGSFIQLDATHWSVQAKAPSTGSGIVAISIADGAYTGTTGVAGLGGSATQGFGPSTGVSESKVGTAGDDTFVGGDGNDTFVTEGGADKVFAGDGADTITLNTDNLAQMENVGNGMVIDGGRGVNTLVLDAADTTFDLTNAHIAAKLHNISNIDLGISAYEMVDGHLTPRGSTNLRLSADNVLALSGESKMLVINGVQGDGVFFVNNTDWVQSDPKSGQELADLYGADYNFNVDDYYYAYSLNGATVLINYLLGTPSNWSPTDAYSDAVTQPMSIDSLFASTFSDAEAGVGVNAQSFKGVAVTFAGTQADAMLLGKFQYLDDNDAWVDLSSNLTDSNAVYLSHTTQIRFIAATGNAALVKPDLKVRLIDTSGLTQTDNLATGATVDAQGNGSTTAFSGNVVSLTDQVTAKITLDSTTAPSNGSTGGVATYTLTFSREVDPATVTLEDFAVTHLSQLGDISIGVATDLTYRSATHNWTFKVAEPAAVTGTTLISVADASYISISGSKGLGVTVNSNGAGLDTNEATLTASADGMTVDVTEVNTFEALQGVSTVNMTGGGHNTIKLDLHAVMQLSGATDNPLTVGVDESHMLVVNGNGTGANGASDVLQLVDSASWSTTDTGLTASSLTNAYGASATFTAGHSYTQYTNGLATLWVDEHMYVAQM